MKIALIFSATLVGFIFSALSMELYMHFFQKRVLAIQQAGPNEPLEITNILSSFFSPYTANAYLGESTKRKSFYAHDSDLGYTIKPQARIAHARFARGGITYYDVNYGITSHGFRRSETGTAKKNIALFFGDSFTFGDGVNDEETFPWIFSAHHPQQWSALNLGVPGWSLQHILHFLEMKRERIFTEGKSVQADVLYLSPTLLSRLNNEGRGFLVYSFAKDPPQFLRFVHASPQFCSLVFCQFLRQAWLKIHPDTPLDDEIKFEQAARLLAQIQAILHSRYGIHLTLFSFGSSTSDYYKKLQKSLIARHLQIAFPHPKKGEWTHEETIPFDGHPTAATQQNIAARILEQLPQ